MAARSRRRLLPDHVPGATVRGRQTSAVPAVRKGARMPMKRRPMRLTTDLVARVPAFLRDPDPSTAAAAPVHLSQAEHDLVVGRTLAAAPAGGGVWVFAYGSLIWNPACEVAEERIGVAHGWHRAFCLGWTTVLRASPGRPGLMLALDRGGQCKGVVYRLPPDAVAESLGKLVRREMLGQPSPMVPRWVTVRTEAGPLRAITFVIDRRSGLYVRDLQIADVADALATATGERGSMAEYLFSTVTHLEARGIHDRHLWQLQDMVADRLSRIAAP